MKHKHRNHRGETLIREWQNGCVTLHHVATLIPCRQTRRERVTPFETCNARSLPAQLLGRRSRTSANLKHMVAQRRP